MITMSETQQQSPQVEFIIQKIFTHDVSFESPNTPEIFKSEWKPHADIEMNTHSERLDEQHYQVDLKITVTAKCNEKVAFLAEVKQSGIFTITGLQESEQLSHLLGSYCPSVLFPYAREAVSGLVSRGGFPEMQLAPVNFDMLYAQTRAQQQPNTPVVN